MIPDLQSRYQNNLQLTSLEKTFFSHKPSQISQMSEHKQLKI